MACRVDLESREIIVLVSLDLPNWTRRSCIHHAKIKISALLVAPIVIGVPVSCMSTFPINLDQVDLGCGEKEGFSEDGY
jgi:hypothetical protein